MARILDFDSGRSEPAEMDPQAYQLWLAQLQGPDQTWLAGFRAPTVLRATNLTYRQLDYWARQGTLMPEVVEASGSGSHRLYSFEDICLAALDKHLITDGFTVEAAAQANKRIRMSGQRICEAAGVFAPVIPGSLLADTQVSPELQDFLVMTERDVRALAATASKAVIWLPHAA